MLTRIVFPIALIVALSMTALGQIYPREIRGYKVYEAKISLASANKKGSAPAAAEALITIGHPKLIDIGLTGVQLEFGAQVAATGHNGRVDFLTFREFRVNGIAVEIEEYDHPFAFTRGQPITLPQPTRVFIRSTSIVSSTYNELVQLQDEWDISGTVFVFGKFKKFGLSFKRVVPIRIDIKIASPIKHPTSAGN